MGEKWVGTLKAALKKQYADYEDQLLKCAYSQKYGPAAYQLGMIQEVLKNESWEKILEYYRNGTMWGSRECAFALADQYKIDTERYKRYRAIVGSLRENQSLRFPRLNEAIPAEGPLPPWKGIEDAMAPETLAYIHRLPAGEDVEQANPFPCAPRVACPKTGWWEPVLPPEHPDAALLRQLGRPLWVQAGQPMPSVSQNQALNAQIRWHWRSDQA